MENKENRLLKFLNKLVFRFAICFAGIILLWSAVSLFDTVHSTPSIPCSVILWMALFSLLISVAFIITDLLSGIKKINTVILRLIHFLLSYISFVMVFIVGDASDIYFANNAYTSPILKGMLLSFLFIGIYAVIGFIRIITASIIQRLMNNRKEYKNIYTE